MMSDHKVRRLGYLRSLLINFDIFQVIQVDEENRKLIFSEKEAVWSKFSDQVNIGDIFEAKVGSVEDYGAFVHLRFPDGKYFCLNICYLICIVFEIHKFLSCQQF